MPVLRANGISPPATKRFYETVAVWEPNIHAFVEIVAPDAVHEIDGPLNRLTVGVKDIIDVAGFPTRNGSKACKDAPPAPKDAPVVAALRNAGARIMGKTTTTEFAFTDPTACRNPFDLNRTPGGSSSGSGAAVAAGLVDIALGTQTAGSLCRPAAYCGVVGFKPSYGVLPNEGVTPLAPSFDSLGIIAGSVGLVHEAFAVMCPAVTTTPELADPKLVHGLWNTHISAAADTLVALHHAASLCASLGMGAGETVLNAPVDLIVTAHRCVMNYEAAMAHGEMLSDRRGNMLQPKFLAGLRAGAAISSDEAAQAAAYLKRARDAFWDALDNVDVVLTLPVPDGAPFIDGTTGYQGWLTPWTVFGGPLICLPWGLDTLGRPRSVMLAAKPGQDAQLLRVASKLEAQGPPRPLPRLPKT
jgi:Asp-tRNA(Asn)/Glu-tRNA(Gln) amidotransferase A subunit family amidase